MQILKFDIPPVMPLSVGKRYGNVLQNILAVLLYPRDEIVDNTLLTPSPFLATPSALLAVLVRCQGESPDEYRKG